MKDQFSAKQIGLINRMKSCMKSLHEYEEKKQQKALSLTAMAAEAVMIPEFGNDGLIKNPKITEKLDNERFPQPVSQRYRSSFLSFGYSKIPDQNPRCFDIEFYTRLSIDTILFPIFTSYESKIMQHKISRTMMSMKPVLIKDFDFMLQHSHQNYTYDVQKEESFFQPQELFKGKTILDIQLVEPEVVRNAIIKYLQQKEESQEEEDSTS